MAMIRASNTSCPNVIPRAGVREGLAVELGGSLGQDSEEIVGKVIGMPSNLGPITRCVKAWLC